MVVDGYSRACAVVAAAVVFSLHPTPAPGDSGSAPQQDGWTMTSTGPLGPADRDLLVKVRLAGLWEMPAGDAAQQRGVNPKVREAGKKISSEHGTLDEQVRWAAEKLEVPLPNEPNADQKKWLGEMAAAQGEEFDRVFVDRLRTAHGKVFSVIAAVRAGTRNSIVRSFAATSNAAVLRHLGYLESTGLVDFDSLPAPPDPKAAAAVANIQPASQNRLGGVDPLVIWLVLAAALVAALTTAARVIRSR